MGVRARGLVKRFGAFTALDGVDCDASNGQLVAITGSNGAGKTTLLRVLATVLRADEGSAWIDDLEVSHHEHEVRAKIGVALVSDRGLYWRLSGIENLAFFARTHGMRRNEARERAAEAATRLGLQQIATKPVLSYSTGQRQRLVLARAIVTGPSVLLIDEPMRGLDDEGIGTVRKILRSAANAGATVLVAAPTTHDLDEIADVIYTLDAGRVKERTVSLKAVAR